MPFLKQFSAVYANLIIQGENRPFGLYSPEAILPSCH